MHSMAAPYASEDRTGVLPDVPLRGTRHCPNLLSPIELPGGIVLPNRVLMGSMHTGLEDAPNGFERLAAFYGERARGGVGLIATHVRAVRRGFTSPPRGGGAASPSLARARLDRPARSRLPSVLYDAATAIGGQFNLARRIPGKEEFQHTLRYFARRLEVINVDVQLGRAVAADELVAVGYDHVVLATGVTPRLPDISGMDHPSVVGYADLITGNVTAGRRVTIIGAGGIGFDVAELLTHAEPEGDTPLERFAASWGIDLGVRVPGGLVPARDAPSSREVWLLPRKPTRLGQGLGKTTGWIRRAISSARGCTCWVVSATNASTTPGSTSSSAMNRA